MKEQILVKWLETNTIKNAKCLEKHHWKKISFKKKSERRGGAWGFFKTYIHLFFKWSFKIDAKFCGVVDWMLQVVVYNRANAAEDDTNRVRQTNCILLRSLTRTLPLTLCLSHIQTHNNQSINCTSCQMSTHFNSTLIIHYTYISNYIQCKDTRKGAVTFLLFFLVSFCRYSFSKLQIKKKNVLELITASL